MSQSSTRALLGRVAAHPVTFLLAINIACAGLGLVQFGYALAVLKPSDFAVIGVLAAIGGVVTGLLDVKLSDLTTRLFFAVPEKERARRAGVLTASLGLHVAVGITIGALVLVAAALLAPHLLERTPAPWWIGAMALRTAAAYPVNAMTSFLRLVGAFSTAGWLRLVIQLGVTLVTLGGLWLSPDLGGYFGAAVVAAVVSLGLTTVTTARGIGTSLGASLVRRPGAVDLAGFRTAGSFLAGGSLTSLSKLLARSGDTLLVAALAGDMTTGLYRVARQAFDNLAGLTDAVHQFYTPTIVDCVSRKRWDELARHRRRLMSIGAGAAVGALLLSWLVLRPLAAARYPHYVAALPAFEVLASLLVVMLGVHGWLWPMLVAEGRVTAFGAFGLAGATLQLVGITALSAAGILDATTAALTAWAMAAVNYGPLLVRTLRAA